MLSQALAAADPYFTVSTDRTFLPGEKATVHLYTRDVPALEFRLYRVNDPVQFFETLRDVHGFGTGHYGPKEQIEEKTRIERYHDWKHGMWVNIRDFFRGQFTKQSRSQIRAAQGQKQKSKMGTAVMFAEVPLLNSKQLVARWRQEVPSQFLSDRQDVPVESLDKGAYVVEATDGKLRAYTVLVVSDLALVTKFAPGQFLAFTVDRRSGAPVAGTQVEVWNARKKIATTKTDDQGLSLIPLSSGTSADHQQSQSEDTRIVATHGHDVALVAPYYLNFSSDPGEDWVGYIYTDRPVYRPGHPVHFKGILRSRSGEKYRVPAGQQVQMTVQDSNGKQVYQAGANVSAYGSVHGDLNLPADASLGYYFISVRSTAGSPYGMSGGFQVEEYKKPEYEVRVTPDQPRILEGGQATATIEAKYYFGEPVAGAQVKYVVHRTTYWSPFFTYEGPDDDSGQNFADDSDGGGDYDYGGEQLSEQTGKLDSNGRLKITIPTTLDKNKQDLRYRVEARVTDESRREISGFNSVIATYGSFRVGVSADKYMYQPGETMTFTVTAKDYDGNPVQTAFHLELSRWDYRSHYKAFQTADGQTGKDGTATVQLAAQSAGSITAKVTATTPENRQVEGSTWLWIPGGGQQSWQENKQIRIIPDKKSYKAGDTAHLMVMTNVAAAQVLITTEGRTIQSKRVVQSKNKDDKSVMVDVPITADNQPNVFVSATFVHDNTLYTGMKNLKVPADQQHLTVTVEPSQPQFTPGQAASYNITARDAAGNPVAGDFSVGVVDEAIYAIQPDNVQDIYNFFYGGIGDRVGTESSLTFFFTGEAGNRPMILATEFNSKHRRLAQLKPSETLVQPKVRKLFPDTALWLAEVKTDQNGRGQAQLTFPDSLTTWRATVRGATLDTKVGSAVNKVMVRKNVMVRLAVPRFFRQGDDVTVSTIVHNYLPDAKDVQMSLDVKGLTQQETAAVKVNVPSKADQRADWHVHAQNVRESDLLAKALTNQESDAMEITLPVIPYGVKLPDTRSGTVAAANGQAQATINLPGDPMTAAPTLSVSISPSIAGSIFGALDYLTSYPYGCTEQTMSGFLPDIVVARAMKDLNLQSTINTPELEKKIRAGLDRLYDFQHEDGGWGWWKEDESYVFMTAYVISGLAQAKTAGYEIKPEALTNGEKFLKQQLQQHANMRPDLRAYVVYALALDKASDSKMLDEAYGRRSDMNSQGLSMLGLALHAAGDSRDRDVAALLEKQAIVDESEAHWPSDYDYLMEFYIDDSVESTAYALRLLSQTTPASPLLPKAAAYLVNHRDGGYFWLSTKQTSMVVFGLLEYVKVTHEFDADFTADVYVNDAKVLTRHFTKADTMKSELPHVNLTTDQLRQGANSVRIQKSGPGRLYWSARGEYYTTEKKFFQNNKFSLNITRDYYRLAPAQVQDRIVYDLQPLSGEVHSGDVIAVRLSVNGSEWRYLLVEDPIPAGAEFIQRDDLYELRQKTDWWGFWFTRREFYDDHAAFFQTYFKDHKEYVYLLKIVNPGKFRISPASVQPMYQPSVLATTDAATMEVK
ncbi:MAG TPA: MG2 domain-containing protein [Candidatus Angelobacter sp.]|nr:MG2 domain-containing protein [Candidatus Angelobacter sp.]